MSIRTIYLFYFPRVKEPFSDNLSPAYGIWDSLCFGSIPSFRTKELLLSHLDSYFKTNNPYNYILCNEVPSKELTTNIHEVFDGARELPSSRFRRIKKELKKKGDSNLNKT